MLFIYLYHGNLYSDLWKGDLYFRPAAIPELSQLSIFQMSELYQVAQLTGWSQVSDQLSQVC